MDEREDIAVLLRYQCSLKLFVCTVQCRFRSLMLLRHTMHAASKGLHVPVEPELAGCLSLYQVCENVYVWNGTEARRESWLIS